jgi:hypothetical protein
MVFAMWLVDAIGLVPSLYSGYQWFVWGVIGIAVRYDQNMKRAKSTLSSNRIQAESDAMEINTFTTF